MEENFVPIRFPYPEGAKRVSIEKVVVFDVQRGGGESGEPKREVTEYWSLYGRKLAENDPIKDG